MKKEQKTVIYKPTKGKIDLIDRETVYVPKKDSKNSVKSKK